MSARSTHLDLSAIKLLEDWADAAREFIPEAFTPMLVGSALTRPDYRDVDVRIIIPDSEFDALTALASLPRINLMLSLWGQKVTGLPVDCQIQRHTDATEEFGDHRRHPLRRHERAT